MDLPHKVFTSSILNIFVRLAGVSVLFQLVSDQGILYFGACYNLIPAVRGEGVASWGCWKNWCREVHLF